MATPDPDTSIRLNRFLASCGLGSRRSCDDLIKTGQIKVNGKVCTDPGTRIGDNDHVRFGKKRVEPGEIQTYLFNKPRGYVCTKSDEKGRPTIYDLIPNPLHVLNHVGRLDADTEGLLVLTNDGDLAQKLTHPSTKVEKEYMVTLNQSYGPDEMDRLLKGLRIPELGLAKAVGVMHVSPRRMRIILTTGMKRQIRQMFQIMGFRVVKLTRLRIGALWGSDIQTGKMAELTGREIALLASNPPMAKNFRTRPLKASEKKARKRVTKKAAKKIIKRRPKR